MPFTAPTSVAALIVAFRTMVAPDRAEGFSGTVELRFGEERCRGRVVDGRLELERGAAERPDVVITSDTETLKALAFGGWLLDEALQSGALTMMGDKASAQRFFELFRLPEPVMAVGSA